MLGKNIVRLRVQDEKGNKSNPYDFDYIIEQEDRGRFSGDGLSNASSMSATSEPGLILEVANDFSIQGNQRNHKHHPLPPRSLYNRASAIRIKAFRPSGKKKLAISGEWFDQGMNKHLLEVISHDRSLKAASRSQAALIYNHCDGHLYRNGNGALPSLGEASEGGLLAIVQNSPDLTSGHFVAG